MLHWVVYMYGINVTFNNRNNNSLVKLAFITVGTPYEMTWTWIFSKKIIGYEISQIYACHQEATKKELIRIFLSTL